LTLPQRLLNQLNLSDSTFIFSKNVLSNHFTPFAYYAFNEGFGFKITPIRLYLTLPEETTSRRKALLLIQLPVMRGHFFPNIKMLF
jgi:hypothetical protein